MSMSSIPSSLQSEKLYDWAERTGSKVPHPFPFLIYLVIVLMVIAAILSTFGVGMKNPTDGTLVVTKSLLSVEGSHWFLPNVIKDFSGSAPLGAILVLALGADLAEHVGLLPALMAKMALHVNARYVSYMTLSTAFFSHTFSDAALVIILPMDALIFLVVGKYPIADSLAVIVGVGCGFTINLLTITTDVLLSGISTGMVTTFNPQMHISVVDN